MGLTSSLAWAFQPGAAVTTEGRPSDLNALVLISPKPEGFGYVLRAVVASLAPRVPLLLLAGERDNPSKDAVQSVQQVVQRTRLNKVELFPSSLHGYKLLRLEPKVTSAIFRFLETSLKNRPVEWEPQYNLTPVTFGDPQMVLNAKPQTVERPVQGPKTRQRTPRLRSRTRRPTTPRNSREKKASPANHRKTCLRPHPGPRKPDGTD